MAFLEAEAESGFEIFADLAQLQPRIRKADLVVTGEGALDDQSLMGKGVGRVANNCRDAGIPCIALAGFQNLQAGNASALKGSWALTPEFVSREESLRNPALHLARLAAQVAANKLWT
jgi:glycerate kinase